ncbi:MAG: DUF2802 domain-containing protein [Povalibacter sp.]|jgi:hypothetical protein
MFEILPNPSLETLMVAARVMLLGGAFWIFALAFIRWRRSDERATAALHAQLERSFIELRSLHETVSVMSARIDALSERSEIDSRLAPAGSQRGYDVAQRLAKNGSSIEELVANCGITRHEAELLIRLHGSRARDAAPPAVQPPARVARAHQAAAPIAQPQAPDPRAVAGKKRGSLLSVVG